MAAQYSLLDAKPLRCTAGEVQVHFQKFVTNSTSAPDGINPELADITIERDDVGIFLMTFSAGTKPGEVLNMKAEVLGANPGIDCDISYDESTGVFTIKVNDEDDTSGVAAAADTNDITIQVEIWYRRYAS